MRRLAPQALRTSVLPQKLRFCAATLTASKQASYNNFIDNISKNPMYKSQNGGLS